ncbi:MAG: T9SS type A sorting domain-containing protein [Ignavibacterium sp.]|nr:T9SS type A sorting domain-containing protein [Ignavibacterium sp.]
MQGKYGITGEFFIDPSTNLTTTYALSGNPVTGTGWLDGINLQAGDRRLGFSTGPFQMSPGDIQTIVIAEIVAGATPGVDHIAAISLLKYYGDIAQNFYDSNFPVSVSQNDENLTPTEFSLSQNYPNPFNPNTSIKYAISSTQFVTLKVYDLLGREVAILVNEEKPAGVYNVQFTINNVQLSSGIYFYKLQVGDFIETKKMILLK